MAKKWLLITSMVATFVLGVAINRGSTTPRPTQPTIITRVNLRGITQSIPTTTLFTPSETGVFRVSTYWAMTTPGTAANWNLNLNWSDDAGSETNLLAELFATNVPPYDYAVLGFNSTAPPPFVFEAVAGQPVTFNVQDPGGSSNGTCGLALVIERLE